MESSAGGVPLAGFGRLAAFDPLCLSQGPGGPASGALAGGLLPRRRCKAFLALLLAALPSLPSLHLGQGRGGPLESTALHILEFRPRLGNERPAAVHGISKAAPGELHQPEDPTLRASPTSAQWQKEQREEVMKRLQRLRPTWTSGLQEHAICRNTLCEVGRSLGLHITSIESHIWGRHGWVQGSLALQRSPKLREVAIELEERLPSAYLLVHTSHLHRLRATILASHPVYELCMFDLHMTAAKRAKICMDCVMGSLCFAALFFSVDGSALSARSPAECPLEQGSLIWYLFVATFSVLLNFIPRSLQICLAQRGFVRTSLSPHQHLIRTRCKDVAFWLLGICLSTFHLLVIMAFLSDLVESDEWKWMFAFTIVLARKLLLVPLLACVLSSLGTQLADCRQPGGVAAPPKKFGLDLQLAKSGESESPVSRDCGPAWVGKVHELAGRGISLRQLLDFYAELGHSLTGHFDPEKSTTHDAPCPRRGIR